MQKALPLPHVKKFVSWHWMSRTRIPQPPLKAPKNWCLLKQMEMAKRAEKRIKKASVSRRRRRRRNRSLLKKFVDYLKSDSYMFAPLLSRYPSDSHLASNAFVSSSVAGVELTEKGKREKKSLVEQVGDYLNSDSHLYAPLWAPHHHLSSKDDHRRMGMASKKFAVEDMEGTVEKLGNAGEIIRQQHKKTIVKHMVCRSVSASGNFQVNGLTHG